jgi:hypothetical protein
MFAALTSSGLMLFTEPSLGYRILQDCSHTHVELRHLWQIDALRVWPGTVAFCSRCQLALACRGSTSPPLCTASQSQQRLPTHRPFSSSGQYVSHLSLSPHAAWPPHLSSSPLSESASSGFASVARQASTWASAADLLYAALCRPHWLTIQGLLRWHGAPPHSSVASATPPHLLPAHPRHCPVTRFRSDAANAAAQRSPDACQAHRFQSVRLKLSTATPRFCLGEGQDRDWEMLRGRRKG